MKLAASLAPVVVAADGGAHAAAKAGFSPTAVIGDLDSFEPSQAAGIPSDRIHRIADQDTTDFEKCLASLKAPAISTPVGPPPTTTAVISRLRSVSSGVASALSKA